MWMPLLGLIFGFLVGQAFFDFVIPADYATYLSIAIMATLDSALGGVRGVLENSYDGTILISGFFMNGVLAAGLVWMGDLIGADLYYVAIFVFGVRVFQNLAIIRRDLLNRFFPEHRNSVGTTGRDH